MTFLVLMQGPLCLAQLCVSFALNMNLLLLGYNSLDFAVKVIFDNHIFRSFFQHHVLKLKEVFSLESEGVGEALQRREELLVFLSLVKF